MDKSDIEPIIEEVTNEYNQTNQFKIRFLKFYENAVKNNLGRKSLQRLIESVNLPEDEQIDES